MSCLNQYTIGDESDICEFPGKYNGMLVSVCDQLAELQQQLDDQQLLIDNFNSGWSYEQPLNNQSFILYEKYVSGGIGWDYTDNDPNVSPSTGLSWRTVTLDLNAIYTAAGGTLPDNVVGISIDSNGTFSGSNHELLHAQILPGDWTPTVDQDQDDPDDPGGQADAERENALWYRQHISTGSGGVIPIGPDGILKLNWGWNGGYKNATTKIELQINVNGFWVA